MASQAGVTLYRKLGSTAGLYKKLHLSVKRKQESATKKMLQEYLGVQMLDFLLSVLLSPVAGCLALVALVLFASIQVLTLGNFSKYLKSKECYQRPSSTKQQQEPKEEEDSAAEAPVSPVKGSPPPPYNPKLHSRRRRSIDMVVLPTKKQLQKLRSTFKNKDGSKKQGGASDRESITPSSSCTTLSSMDVVISKQAWSL